MLVCNLYNLNSGAYKCDWNSIDLMNPMYFRRGSRKDPEVASASRATLLASLSSNSAAIVASKLPYSPFPNRSLFFL